MSEQASNCRGSHRTRRRMSAGGFPHLIDRDGSLWASFGVTSQPAFVFVNDDGAATVRRGSLDHAELLEHVTELRSR